ncbi:MAG: beta-propeller domain-containing protein [Lachnospiraceae bacterium]|nr:beta-propeller domain-containing protein [Lachnospiraceae bacterium]
MTDLEKRLTEEEVKIPDSLSVENMRKRLEAMSEEEKISRAAGEDVPVIEDSRDKKVIRDYRRFVNPMATAAALFIIVGVGFLMGRGLFRSGKSEAAKDVMSDSTAMTDSATMEMAAVAGETAEAEAEEACEDAEMASEASESASVGGDYEEVYAYFGQIREEEERLRELHSARYAGDFDEEMNMMAEEATADDAASDFNAGENFKGEAAFTEDASLSAAGKQEYSDTNVRTRGVMEGDIVKTDGKYIYVYEEASEHIRIYETDNGQIKPLDGGINVFPEIESGCEIFLQDDVLILLGEDRESYESDELHTVIKTYDISDRSDPKLINSVKQDGAYHSARINNGILYTFSTKNVDVNRIERDKPLTFVPGVDDEPVPPERIFLQEKCRQTRYVVITAFDPEEGCFTDREAVLAGGELLYVSNDHIYLGDTCYDWDSFAVTDSTLLVSFAYNGGVITKQAEGSVPGYLNDDYSLDEKNGHLRLVTTYDEDGIRYNALYILDENLKGISVLKKIAEGEEIKSARFLGDMAYFVTFRNTDPLFAVDLSDENDPRILGYLKIPGFSAYLHPFGDGLLLGIGYDTDVPEWPSPIKLSMFDISDPENIRELETKTLDGKYMASVLEDRNAFYCDTQKSFFGFSLMAADNKGNEIPIYLVSSYDTSDGFDQELLETIGREGSAGAVMDTRGLSIGDYFYIVTAGDNISSYDMKDYFRHVSDAY